MPYRLQYIPSKRCYSVRAKTKKRGLRQKNKTYSSKPKIFSKCTSKIKALRQIKLLRAIKYDPNFRKTIRKKLRRSNRIRLLKKKS